MIERMNKLGQYYLVVNLDKKEFLAPLDYENGAKLMEHSYIGNNFLKAVEFLLSEKGSWYKTRLVWAGDYMDEGLFIEPFAKKGNLRPLFQSNDTTLYSFAYDHFTRINEEFPIIDSIRYIVNHTKKEYCDLEKVGESSYWKIHPLSLFTSSGNGRGGGDYNGDNGEYVGIWAGDIISTEENEPLDYTEIIPDFKE